MKLRQSLILVVALAATGTSATVLAQDAAATAQKAPAYKAHVLSNAELDALLAKPDALLIVDVRRPDEISSIGGFPVYLNIQPAELASRAKAIPRDRTIVTVSNHAARAGKAADALKDLGFKVAGAVGAQTYEEQGGKLTHLAAPTASRAP
ncbi:rhodanese-like domain-containing protein [bacterium]|nr:MAG: rhodanese-like domain-containing protein [bacterium]